MEYVVLGLLILKSMTLYELNKAFKQGIALFYSASYGSLQTTIKSLLKKDLIGFEDQVDNGRHKKVYTISSRGKKAFLQWMQEDTPINKLEVVALSKVYFLGLIECADDKKKILKEIIEKIQTVEEKLEGIEKEISKYEVPDSYKNILFYQVKTLDYGIQAHAVAKDWFIRLLNDVDLRE